jgi:hypothetical protein
MKNIELDNAEKDADLIAANREIEVVSRAPSYQPSELTLRSSVRGSTNSKKNSTNMPLANKTSSMTFNLQIRHSKVPKHTTRT